VSGKTTTADHTLAGHSKSLGKRLSNDFVKNRGAYLMLIPVLAFFLIFHYRPMYGAIIAFKDFRPNLGILGSPWTSHYGFGHFVSFFNSVFFNRTLQNTLIISISTLVFSFPLPIILALSINEVKNRYFKKTVQTLSYMPHFISLVVVCSMVMLFTSETAFIAQIMNFFGFNVTSNLLNSADAFVPIYVVTALWRTTGWSAIIYLAALSTINTELYEAARVDGAGRFKQTLHVTLPGISTTIILLLILAIGNIMNIGWEKIVLLYNEFNAPSSDVIASFVFRRGLVHGDFSFATAVGLFNSAINFVLVLIANGICRKATGSGLW